MFNINLNDDICIICQETLETKPRYKLLECNHEFHTHCIITWFRNGDSSCPYCRNKGINYKNNKNNYWSYSNCMTTPKFRELLSLSKKNDCPPILLKEFNKLDNLKIKLKTISKELQEFKEILKTDKLLYSEAQKNNQKLKKSKTAAAYAIRRQIHNILQLPITPLIIPIYN